VLSTTVGETAADFLSVTMNLGLQTTAVILSGSFILALVYQFKRKRYVPFSYWTVIVLVSVVGTLISDLLVDHYGMTLEFATGMFAAGLAALFALWYAVEKTLSIHTIYSFGREAFYWLPILLTFSLGTAVGDLSAEAMGLGYFQSLPMYAGLIGLVAAGYYSPLKINGVLAFWLAYIFTRPLGASAGDWLSQPVADGGLGLGTTFTSGTFLVLIATLVTYLWVRESGRAVVEL